MYKHVYGDFKKDEKEKASTGTPFVRSWWQTLRSAIQQCSQSSHSQPSKETSGAFPLTEELSLWFSELIWPLRTLFCVLQQSLPPSYHCRWSMKQYTCMLKIVTRLLRECFQILIFCVAIACSFPFLPLLRHYSLLVIQWHKLLHEFAETAIQARFALSSNMVDIFCLCLQLQTNEVTTSSSGHSNKHHT